MTIDDRSLGLLVWFDGWGQAQGQAPATFRRELTASEHVNWQQGWDEGKADLATWETRRTTVPVPTPPAGFVTSRSGNRWVCATCGAKGLPGGTWMATHQRPHHPCTDCGQQLTSKIDNSPRVHTRCPRRTNP